jgi:hypothetical protein
LWADPGELEDGSQVAPVAALGACDGGLYPIEFVFLRFALGFLSLLRSWVVFFRGPTACAAGCILSPLCGWFCGWDCWGIVLPRCDRRGECLALGDSS